VAIRILHLLSPGADFQLRRTGELIARDVGGEFSVERQQLGAGRRLAALDWLSLRRRTPRPGPGSGANPSQQPPVELVHAFGLAALSAAALAGHRRILFSPMPAISPRALRWLAAVMSYCDVQVICATATQHRQLVTRGVPMQRCHFIRPAVEFSRIRGRRRDTTLRASLGLADEDIVLLAPGESTPPAQHNLAVWTCGILHVLDVRHRLLLWGRGRNAAAATTLARRVNQRRMVVDATAVLGAETDFESLLPAVDVALFTASGPVATLPVAQTMAAALPIVAVTNRLSTELLEDRHTALLVTRATPRLLAQRVLDVLENRDLAWSLGDMARTEAFEYFSASRLLNAYRTVYRQMALGESVSVPTAEAGAGLRFHGRG
jgi:glycosyltransferase involved in cell wall biosynthesis